MKKYYIAKILPLKNIKIKKEKQKKFLKEVAILFDKYSDCNMVAIQNCNISTDIQYDFLKNVYGYITKNVFSKLKQ